jgi:GGDEF domain-containing protein
MQRYQAQYDPLTNIFNHGEILSVLEREIERANGRIPVWQ